MMNTPLAMSNMMPGQSGIVTVLNTKESLKRRLQELGLLEGTYLECVLKSPSGDPKAYRINGALIAIRHEDCNEILLQVK